MQHPVSDRADDAGGAAAPTLPTGRVGRGWATRGSGRAHRVFHPLVGADLRTLCASLYRGGGVAPRRAHVAAIALSTALLRLPFTAAEAAALRWRLRWQPALPAPVFILGHWRSGTTHLANTLSRSGEFGILPPISVGLPWEAMGLARLMAPLIEQFFPRNRLIDAVALAPDLPQEDEIALANMSLLSFYHGIYFPRTLEANFKRGLFFDGCSPAEIGRWASALRLFVAKMTLQQGGKPLLIRNPVHSARIPLLRSIWPEAKFIHVYRNPYVVYASSKRMFSTLLRELSLQDEAADLDALVLRTYPRLLGRLLEDARTLPRGSFAELRFEDFQRAPLDELDRLLGELDLPGAKTSRPAFAAYLATTRQYRTAAHRWQADELDRVSEHWSPFLQRWGYGTPEDV